MNLRSIILICVCCFSCFSLSAQDLRRSCKVFLNDGSIIKGVIISETPKKLVVRLNNGIDMSLPTNFIKKLKVKEGVELGTIDLILLNDGSTIKGITLERTPVNTTVKLTSGTQISLPTNSIRQIKNGKQSFTYFNNGKARKNDGYYGFVKAGLLLARTGSGYLDQGVSIQTVHGIRINKKLAVGTGVGFNRYDYFDLFPIYGHVRYEPFDRKVRPYITGNIGYGLALNFNAWDNKVGGLMLQPAIGVQFSSTSGGGIFLELGQKLQWAKNKYDWGESDEFLFNRTALSLGYQF